MVEIQSAVKAATDFARGTLGADRTRSIRLEEIESSRVDGKEVWLVTLSSVLIDDAMVTAGPLSGLQRMIEAPREYKIFTVSKETGEVLAMKIRMPAAPAA
jgi:hypothetical protein